MLVVNTPNNQRNKLRVGVSLDAVQVPAWQFALLTEIKRSACAEIALIMLPRVEASRAEVSCGSDPEWGGLIYRAYRKFDERLFEYTPDACENTDARSLLANVTTFAAKPTPARSADAIGRNDVSRIRDFDIDVLISLGSLVGHADLASCAHCGVWFYDHRETGTSKGAPVGFWEVFEGRRITSAALLVLTEGSDRPLVACEGYFATERLSVGRNGNNCYWKSVSLIPRMLNRLHRMGKARFLAALEASDQHRVAVRSRRRARPNGVQFLGLALFHFTRYASFKLSSWIFLHQWILMFGLSGETGSHRDFQKIVPPKDSDWADPFIICKDDVYYIFFEELPYREKKAHISVFEMDQSGNYGAPTTVLEQPYHLSYPFVFEWRGHYYMIPESASNRTIDVYQCMQFPTEWRHHKTLMRNVTAFDGTLLHYEDKWWLFATVQESPGVSTWDQLFLFYADDPLSDVWTPHPENPIVSDVRNARPAGKIFEHGGTLYRPAQDCSKGYGYAIHINRIVKLSETEYEEERVRSIEPTWDPSITKTHTLNCEDRLTVIDAVFKRLALTRCLPTFLKRKTYSKKRARPTAL